MGRTQVPESMIVGQEKCSIASREVNECEPLRRYCVLPVARKVWQPIGERMPAAREGRKTA